MYQLIQQGDMNIKEKIKLRDCASYGVLIPETTVDRFCGVNEE